MSTTNIDEKLNRLAEIADWFDTQEEVDVEQGLEKVKEASVLIAASKTRLKDIENEFEEIKKEIDPEIEKETITIEKTETTKIKVQTEDSSDDMPF